MSREILDCLKRKQDICIKNIIPSQNTAYMFTPALKQNRLDYQSLRCSGKDLLTGVRRHLEIERKSKIRAFIIIIIIIISLSTY